MLLRFPIIVIAVVVVGVVSADLGPPIASSESAHGAVSVNSTAVNAHSASDTSGSAGHGSAPANGTSSILSAGNGSSASTLPSLVTGPIAIPTLAPHTAGNSSEHAPTAANGTVPILNVTSSTGSTGNGSSSVHAPLTFNGTLPLGLLPNGTMPSMPSNGTMTGNFTLPAMVMNGTMPSMPSNGTGNFTLPAMIMNGSIPLLGGNGTMAPSNGTSPISPLAPFLPSNGSTVPANGTTVKPAFPPLIPMSANGSVSALPMNATMLPLNGTLPMGVTTPKPMNGTLNGTTLSQIVGLTTTTIKPGTVGNSTTMAPPGGTTTSYCSSGDALVFAGTCYLTLTGLATEMENMDNGKMIDTASIQTVAGYCKTFQTCLTQLTPCGDFNDTTATSTISEFCTFYRFATSNLFIGCTTKMATVDPKYQTCMTAASAVMLDFNSTLPVKCAALKNTTNCAVTEVENQCSIISTYSYQMFVNRHLQQWNC